MSDLSEREGTEVLKRRQQFSGCGNSCRKWLWTCRKADYIMNQLAVKDVGLVVELEMSFLSETYI